MTTNNHPAHGPVSLKRLHQISEILSKAAAQRDGGNLGYAMADAVKVIDEAIAAFGAEPAPVDIEMLATVLRNAPLAPSDSQGKPRAPVVPEVMANPDESQYGGAGDEDYRAEYAYVEGWNACRAAMLQAGNHTEQHLDMVGHSGDANQKVDFRLPFAQWLSQQNEPIDVDCGCVTTEAFYHWLRVAYDAGNSPVIPDGWVLVSKRMPEGMKTVITSNGFDIGQGWWDGECWKSFDCHDVVPGKVTHWMPLPAAPQQEVK